MNTTNKAKHTPGPWKLKIRDGWIEEQRCDVSCAPTAEIYIKNRHIATVSLVSVGYSGTQEERETTEANARLMLAAPDMGDLLAELQHEAGLPASQVRKIQDVLVKAGIV